MTHRKKETWRIRRQEIVTRETERQRHNLSLTYKGQIWDTHSHDTGLYTHGLQTNKSVVHLHSHQAVSHNTQPPLHRHNNAYSITTVTMVTDTRFMPTGGNHSHEVTHTHKGQSLPPVHSHMCTDAKAQPYVQACRVVSSLHYQSHTCHWPCPQLTHSQATPESKQPDRLIYRHVEPVRWIWVTMSLQSSTFRESFLGYHKTSIFSDTITPRKEMTATKKHYTHVSTMYLISCFSSTQLPNSISQGYPCSHALRIADRFRRHTHAYIHIAKTVVHI